MTERMLIVNADDFGVSTGVNRGIVEAHQKGIVTSASFMVTGHAVDEAVEMSRENPGLAVGLHWDVWGEDERDFDLTDGAAIRAEFARQMEEFHRLFDRAPTHVDSHKHAHLQPGVLPLFTELVAPYGVPLRGDGRVRYLSGFYAQWEWKVTNLEYVSVDFLKRMLAEEVSEGWSELGCHPGYASPDYEAVYLSEREEEVRTLTASAVRDTLTELGIDLVSYADWHE